MAKQSKEKVHGRRKHLAAGGCDTGRMPYRTKAQAETAHPGAQIKRCDRCRQWHAHETSGRRR